MNVPVELNQRLSVNEPRRHHRIKCINRDLSVRTFPVIQNSLSCHFVLILILTKPTNGYKILHLVRPLWHFSFAKIYCDLEYSTNLLALNFVSEIHLSEWASVWMCESFLESTVWMLTEKSDTILKSSFRNFIYLAVSCAVYEWIYMRLHPHIIHDLMPPHLPGKGMTQSNFYAVYPIK